LTCKFQLARSFPQRGHGAHDGQACCSPAFADVHGRPVDACVRAGAELKFSQDDDCVRLCACVQHVERAKKGPADRQTLAGALLSCRQQQWAPSEQRRGARILRTLSETFSHKSSWWSRSRRCRHDEWRRRRRCDEWRRRRRCDEWWRWRGNTTNELCRRQFGAKPIAAGVARLLCNMGTAWARVATFGRVRARETIRHRVDVAYHRARVSLAGGVGGTAWPFHMAKSSSGSDTVLCESLASMRASERTNGQTNERTNEQTERTERR
jgi:hypothetical protein